ncbi:MAG: SMP-30/gluconolactonase/LRE family protein [Propionibacteriales bacterium]|nr:SMP-30/gluconolactonase/LRE family protein [Propionibacteriales bacterium]
MSWTAVPGGHGYLFESPRWVTEEKLFQWVDILGATISRWDPVRPTQIESRHLPLDFVTAALPLDGHRSIVASRNALFEYAWNRDQLTPLTSCDFPPSIRFNDGSISPGGEIFIGTMSMTGARDEASLYRYDPAARSLQPVISGIGISNGLAWIDDTTALYVDSLSGSIDTLSLDDDPVRRTVWISVATGEEPDGLAIDAEGRVHVAFWGSGEVRRFTSDGRPLPSWEVPHPMVTSLAFSTGCPSTVVVTTAGSAVPSLDEDARGSVFTKVL